MPVEVITDFEYVHEGIIAVYIVLFAVIMAYLMFLRSNKK